MKRLNSVIIEGVIVEKGEDSAILSYIANPYIYNFNIKFKNNMSATFGRLRNGHLVRIVGSLEQSENKVVINSEHIEIVNAVVPSEAASSTISNE
jgi:hypothetical protein